MSESGSRSCKKKPYKDKGRERDRVRGTWNASGGQAREAMRVDGELEREQRRRVSLE